MLFALLTYPTAVSLHSLNPCLITGHWRAIKHHRSERNGGTSAFGAVLLS